MIIFWVWIFHLVVIVKIQKMFSNITLFVGLGFCLFEKKHFKTSKLFCCAIFGCRKEPAYSRLCNIAHTIYE